VSDLTSLPTSLSTDPVATISGRSTRSAAVAIGRTTDGNATSNECYATKSDAHKRSGKSKQNEKKTLPVSTFSSRQTAELKALDGAAIPMTVTAVSEVPAKVATPSESENIVPSLGADGADSSGPASELCINELLSFVGFYRSKSNVEALRRTVLSFFIPNDICQAKKMLSLKYATKLEPLSIFGGKA